MCFRNFSSAAARALLIVALIHGPAPISSAQPAATRSGVILDNMDRSIRPQADLFEHANGTWLRTVAIPPDRSRYGVDSIMAERSLLQQRAILEAARSAAHPSDRKVGALYASFMNEAEIERAGLKPLRAELARIEAVRSTSALGPLMAHLDRLGVSTPLSSFNDPDAKRSDRYAFWIYGSGLGMPARDYYLSDEPRLVDTRRKYEAHLARMLSLLGDRTSAKSARDILALETQIARTHWSRADALDPEKTYNPVSLADLSELAPQVDWQAYVEAQKLPSPLPRIIARQPSTVSEVAKLLESVPLSTWKAYFKARLVSTFAPYLPRAFAAEQFAFQQGVLQGVQSPQERWKRGVALADGLMGEALGRMYVARHFPSEAKKSADMMVSNLIAAYRCAIHGADWMEPATKAEALRKLENMNVKIGHPTVWRDYSALRISATDLLGNVLRARMFEADRQRARMSGPVDKSEWRMTAPTVDAYYSPTTNEIAFPAGILQPPLFDPAADDAYNYGSTGATIGHEIGHGFDSRGSRYDSAGNLRDWWSPEDRRRFEAKTALLVERFNGFEPLPGQRIDGRLTLSENMADLAGLEIAYLAYRASLGDQEPPVIDGLSGDQRFFLGYAQSYMGKRRDELLLSQLKTNSHSPERYRVNGIVSNLRAFQDAFAVRLDDRMHVPEAKRVQLWLDVQSRREVESR